MTTKKATYIATRGVAWQTPKGEVNREEGDDVSDAPERLIKEALAADPPAVKEA